MPAKLAAYLARIGLEDCPAPNADGLNMLQTAHRQSIPFENLDIALNRGILIDSDSAFAKLVERRRGGYCFEQNRLFADMLALVGIATRPLLARVRLNIQDGSVPPRSHICLLADVEGTDWIADAGFGGSFVPPLTLADGAEATTPDGARHRLKRHKTRGSLEGEWLLERAGPLETTDGRAAAHADWQPQYSFDLCEVAAEDLEQANHWTSTRPNTRFTAHSIASIVLPDGFAALMDGNYAIWQNGNHETRQIKKAEDYRSMLFNMFGIELSAKEILQLPMFR